MLKKIRVAVASFFLIALTFVFIDFTGTALRWFGWTTRLQFVPAILAHSVVAVIGILALTFLFGRVYCSAICPLGIWQDVTSWKLSWFGKKKNRFSYRKPRKVFVIARYAILGIFALALVLQIPFVSTLLEPYSAFGRMISQIFAPIYKYGNNILAGFAERAGSFAFAEVDIWLTNATALVIAVVTLITISIFAAKSGRGYCNAICPVGTLLGVASKFSFVKMRILKDVCVKCGVCAKNCKAGCIDSANIEIDYSRCVACFNCANVCPKNAIKFAAEKSLLSTEKSSNDKLTQDGLARRNMLAATATLALGAASSAIARTYEFDGGLAPLEDKIAPPRTTPIVPPGAQSRRNLRAHCTGCQLCVGACANNVLRPSSDLQNFMQPQLSFERGYCHPKCVRCSQVCPTNAIRPISREEKSALQIGYAVWNGERCVVNVDNVSCDLCERRCPAGAIMRIPRDASDESSLKIPMIDTARCTGCGACEHFCPSRPVSAIYVEGVEGHRTI